MRASRKRRAPSAHDLRDARRIVHRHQALNAANTPFGRPRTKHALHVLDHCAIFLRISGTYTPLALTVLHDTRGYLLLGLVWSLSLFGLHLVVMRRNPRRGSARGSTPIT